MCIEYDNYNLLYDLVENGYNEIEFTKAKHLLGKRFKVHSTDIKSSPIISNGKIQCYAVPFDKLIKI